ncbi:MAG: sulfatase [Terriglobia bacterium]
MTDRNDRFGRVLFSLWLRLIVVAVLGLLIAASPSFPNLIAGWRYYETSGEILFGIAVRAVFIGVAGVALAALCAVAAAPFLLNVSTRTSRAWAVTRLAVGIAAFCDLSVAARVVLTPLTRSMGLIWFPIMIVYIIGFSVAMLFPRPRQQIVTSLDGLLSEKATRRTAMTVGIASAGMVAAEFTMGRVAAATASSAPARRVAGPSRPNVLVVTFDALTAEDMSLYGYRLPTTPRIEEFARRSSVFTNFYTASTFTTPGVATLFTGLYPSDHHVYHLQGRFTPDIARKALPRLMREAGYTTGASTTSPFVYCLLEDIATDFDHFPDSVYRTDGLDLWGATKILHQRQPFGRRASEFTDVEKLRDYPANNLAKYSPRLFARTKSGYSPEANFAQARQIIDKMPEGFFLWVHLFAPHMPYLPDEPWMGRFLKSDELRSTYQQNRYFGLGPYYKPESQPEIDKGRLRYDEFIANADSAFGSFMSSLESSGRLANTSVIVSSDHGESFEGGYQGHGNDAQNRPLLHIPLIIRMPGQQEGNRVALTADATSVAPTILEMAGIARPEGMRGQSLIPWLKTAELPTRVPPESGGLAFTQYLARNSIFRPVREGTVGVIDDQHQYVLDLSSGKGRLRTLEEAHIWDLDRSADNPALARTLRDAIYSRFPDLPHQHG